MTKDLLVKDSSLWKIVTRGGAVSAVVCYTDKYGGRKSIAAASVNTSVGKQDLFSIWGEDINLKDRGVFSEVSGKVESIKLSLGAVPIPADIAQKILHDKPFLSVSEDGYHYTRMIAGEPHEKIMVTGSFYSS